MERAKLLLGHLSNRREGKLTVQNSEVWSLFGKKNGAKFEDSDDDVVVLAALRTPICKAKRGAFRNTHPDDLLATVFSAVLKTAGVEPELVGDICVGNVLQPGAGANSCRAAQFYAGIPETVPLMVCNRQCSSGLQAVMNVAGAIRSGVCDIAIGAGVESMSSRDMAQSIGDINPRMMEVKKAADCLIPMGITSENVAEKFGISREKQDRFSLLSHQRASKATLNGLFADEIIPVITRVKDENGSETTITVVRDDGIRPKTTMEGLTKLKAVFKEGGTTTAGNSSQVSDGAAAVVLARRSAAKKLGSPLLGVLRSYAVVGVPPEIMGIGPAVAIPKALEKAGLTIDDIDVFEINEAFASQATYCIEKLNIPLEKVNPKGGAIAFGHPLGCTGTRQVATLLHELKRRRIKSYGVVSMCIGTGMGAAAVFEFPGEPKN